MGGRRRRLPDGIRRLPNGRYQITVEVGSAGGTRKRVARTFDTVGECEVAREQLVRAPADLARKTVAEAVQRFIDKRGPTKAPNTDNGYRSVYRNHIAGTDLGKIRLERLNHDVLEDHYARLAQRGLASNTVRNVHALIRVALNLAKRSGWITNNPCDLVELDTSPAVEPLRFDLVAIAKVLEHASADTVELAQTAIATGARQGELAALRWSDVDLATGVVCFAGSISKARGYRGWERKDTKTHRARTLQVDEACRTMLEQRYLRQTEQVADVGLAPETLDRCAVFSPILESDGTSPAALGAAWRRACDEVGVKLRFHDLRHLNATEMMAGGVPVANATARGGWASNRMYFDTYSHATDHADDQAVAVLADLWRRIDMHRAP